MQVIRILIRIDMQVIRFLDFAPCKLSDFSTLQNCKKTLGQLEKMSENPGGNLRKCQKTLGQLEKVSENPGAT
jgi:hypothetical protein